MSNRWGLIRFVGGPAHNQFRFLSEWRPSLEFAVMPAHIDWRFDSPSEERVKIESVKYRLQKIISRGGTLYFEYILEGKPESECHPAEFVNGFDLDEFVVCQKLAAAKAGLKPLRYRGDFDLAGSAANIQGHFASGPAGVLSIGGVPVAKVTHWSMGELKGKDA